VWTASQEAKPHLAGLALLLLAIAAATKFMERGRSAHALLAGTLVGAAAGMVLSMAVGWVVLLTMVVLMKTRSDGSRFTPLDKARTLGLSTIAAVVVFAISNPFVLVNALVRPELLGSNLGNTAAMYPASLAGALRGIEVLAAGTGWVILICGVLGVLVLLAKHLRQGPPPVESAPACGCAGPMAPLWLLLPVALLVLAGFVVFAFNKPAEYARFAMVVSTLLLVAAFAAVRALMRRADWAILLAVAVGGGSIGLSVFDRVQAAEQARVMVQRVEGSRESIARRPRVAIGTFFEPAPWSMPPFDLFERRIILLPTQGEKDPEDLAQVLIYPANLARDIGMRDPRERIDWKHGVRIVVTTW
jgi:hypothetical protein